MLKELKFAFYAIKKNFQNGLELRTSFFTNVFGMAINNTAFIIIWVSFTKSIGILNGWTAIDIIGLIGFSSLTFGLTFSFASGFRKLSEYVTMGSFDRYILSPKNLILRIATSWFSPSGIGDIVFGIITLIIYGILISATAFQIFLIFILSITATICMIAISITIFSASFLFADSRAITDGLLHFFLSPSLFHGGAFQGGIRFVFTFLVPSLVVGALPVEALKDIDILKVLLILFISVIWFYISVKIFYKGVEKYESTNFMTFGN
ncbi:MAG: ABC-2 family transporter protein [Candidatus Paceibacterota bacterium]|jgi:ABC-2 type transport system permease protein